MKYFKDHASMIAEADALITEDRWDAEDRATIQEFYNGRETMSQTEAEARGVDNITNHLFGFDSMNTAAGQLMGIYTKPKVTFEFEFPNAPMEHRHEWEMCVTKNINEIIKESRRLKPQWKAMSGELTLHGRASFIFLDNEDWCPKFARPYVPRGTGVMSDEVPYCVVPDYLTLPDLEKGLEQAEERQKKGWEVRWHIKELRITIDLLKGNIGGEPGVLNYSTDSSIPADERAEQRRAGAEGSSGLRTRIPVYYFYYKNEAGGYDMTILPRLTRQQQKTLTDKVKSVPTVLFEHKDFFERPRHFIHPFFIDCELGGVTTWHRCMGLGRLNYEPDVEMEQFFNDAMQGSRENLRRLYQVSTAADWEMMKTWAAGTGPSNVLPPGVGIAEARLQPNFQHAFTTMDMLMNLSRRNTSGHAPNMGQTDTAELEVNALERQGRNAEALSTRIADVYECVDALGMEIFRRFIAETPLPQDPGYCEIVEFQRRIREKGVSLAHLRKQREGKYVNFRSKCTRAMGDGSQVKRTMINQMLWSRLNLFSHQSQEIIKRRLVAEDTGDYDFAEQIVPYEAKENPDQVTRANQENDTCDKQGIIEVVPELGADDIDDVHLRHHFMSMQADLARGKVRQWDEIDVAGFKAKGAHCAMHIQKIEGIKEQAQLATEYKQQLESLAKQGQEFMNNLQKKREGEEMSAKEQADMQLKAKKQELAERAQTSLEEHRNASLEVSKGKADVSNMVQMRQTALNEQKTMHDERMSEADRVMEARTQGGEAGKPPAPAADEPPPTAPEPEIDDNPVPAPL